MARTYLGVWNTYWFEAGGGGYDPSGDFRGRYKLYYEQNQAQNTTTIYVDHYVHVWSGDPEAHTFTLQNVSTRATINGNQQTITKATVSQRVVFGYNEIFIGTTTHTIYHNAEGKANCQFGGRFSIYNGAAIKTCANTWSLPDIPPASSISANVSEQTLGEQISFTITPKEQTYIHVLKYKYGTSSEVQIATNISTSYNWTPPISMAQYVTNNKYGTATIYCYSYDGSVAEENYKGVSSTTVKLNIPFDLLPTCSLTVTDTNTGSPSEHNKVPVGWGIFVKGYSKLKLEASIDWSGTYGATLSSLTLVNVDGERSSSNPFVSQNFVSTSGSGLVSECYITDSRGNSLYTNDNFGIIVYDYENPSASLNVIRCNNDGTYNANGEYIKATLTYAIEGLLNNNAKEYTLKFRAKGDQSYTTLRSDTLTNYNGTIDILITNRTFDAGTTYEFVATVEDFFNTIDANATVPYAKKPISIKKTKGITFGRHATEDGFNVYYDADFKMNLTKNGFIVPCYQSIYHSDNGEAGDIVTDVDPTTFKFIEIYGTDNNGKRGVFEKIINPTNNTSVCLDVIEASNNTYIRRSQYTLTTTGLTFVSGGYVYLTSSITTNTSQNYIKITDIIGWY